jgi:hypothetical protein
MSGCATAAACRGFTPAAARVPAAGAPPQRSTQRPPVPGLGGSRAACRRLRTASVTPQAELLQQEPPAAANNVRRIGAVPPAEAAATASARSAAPEPLPEPVDDGLIVTTFRWSAALGGHRVSVCGSFSNWEPLVLHRSAAGGDFVRSVALPPGSVYFKYLVDGDWICSPTEQVVQNGKGYNNHR